MSTKHIKRHTHTLLKRGSFIALRITRTENVTKYLGDKIEIFCYNSYMKHPT
jgi:hypothetical protein